MDSEASPSVLLSSTLRTHTPPSGSLLIRAPPSSPEKGDHEAASSSPSSSSSSDQEFFLSGEDEPEFDTNLGRPVFPADEEAAVQVDDGEQVLSPAYLPKRAYTMPKARLSEEDDGVADEVFDDELATDVDGDAAGPQVVRVAPPTTGEGVGDSGWVDGGDGALRENGGDDDEAEAADVRISEDVSLGGAPDGGTDLEVSPDDGAAGYREKETVEGSLAAEPTQQESILGEVVNEEVLPENLVGNEASKDIPPHEKPVSNGSATAELSDPMGSGDASVTGVEDNVVQDAGDDKHVELGDGEMEGADRDADIVRDPVVVKLQSSSGFINGTQENSAFDGECEKGGGTLSGSGEEKSCTIPVGLELKPGEAESEVGGEENGARSAQKPETKERAQEVEENGEPKMNISVDSGYSVRKPDHFDSAEVINEGVPSESKKEVGEIEQDSWCGTREERSSVTQVVIELKPDEAESEVMAEESGDRSGSSLDYGLVKISTFKVETQEWQPSETQDINWQTEEEEEKVLDSSETKGGVGEAESHEAVKVVDIPSDSGDVKYLLQKADRLDRAEVANESAPPEPREEGDEIEQVNSTELELIIGSSDNDVYSDLVEDSMDGKLDGEVPLALEAIDNENAPAISFPGSDLKETDYISPETDDVEQMDLNMQEEKVVVADGQAKFTTLGSPETAEQIIEALEEGPSGTSSSSGSSLGYPNQTDGQIVSDSDEEIGTDEEEDGKELFDSAALTALLKAATDASSDGSITLTAPEVTRMFSVDRPAGLGSSATSLSPAAPRTIRPNLFSPSDLAGVGESGSNIDEEEKKLQEKIEQIRVKFLRLVHRLGHSPEDRVAAQVLYRLGLAEGIRRGRQIVQAFSFENAKEKALQLEEVDKGTLDFSCNILVLGKTGVGKSATINSIFGEEKVDTDAFEQVTTSVKEIIGTVDGIKLHVIDTPGLKPSVMDQSANKRILASIKKYTKKCPPDIVLYVDRLDTLTWDFNDLPLLRSIASTLGSSIWFNAIIALTHAASAPPDGPSGSPLSYELFVDQRSRVVQHTIRQASGDMRLMNPVALVENHPSCRRNREGQRVLPNGLSWRTQMLLLCYSSKILSDANSLLKLQETSPGKLFGFRVRSPPLPFLLSSLLQSRAHPKLSTYQGVDSGDSDIDLGDLSDSDQEEEEEYDQLPPFKPLRKAQIAKLSKEQRKAYFDEYDYRVKLLQRKQWKDELKSLKEIKKRGKVGQGESEYGDMADDYDQDGAPATVPVPLPDMVLPASFDGDSPAYRYRFLEPTSQLIVRPVLDTHGWDHDCGYDGVSLEENLAVASRFPAAISVQITKDKKDFSMHLDSSVSAKHGESGSTLAGFDIQSVGKQMAYILRSETKFKNVKKNKTTAGISVTFLGENIATGLKVEDQLMVGKRLGFVASTGAVRAQGDVAYGANLEVRFREKDFPIGQDVSTLGLSLMRWHNDLALGANLQSHFSVGRNSKMAVRVGLNNKLSGQITVRTSTSEPLQMALLGILSIAVSIYRSIWSGESDCVRQL